MKSNNLFLFLAIALLTSCSVGSSGGGSSTPPPTLQSLIAVTPANPHVAAGIPVQFTATGILSNNSTPQNVTTYVTWNSTNPSVAAISNASGLQGLATWGTSTGTSLITASSGSFSASTTITVTSAQLVSITVTPATASISTGTQQYTASGAFSDNSSHDITTAVAWNSSNPGVATISNATGSQGIAMSVAPGTAMIRAVSGTAPGSAMLTVTGGAPFADNVLPVTVNGSLCSANPSYLNKPCVSIQVCTPGSTCQTINDIILDTGSFGLRIFNQVLTTVSLTQIASGSGILAECAQFGDGTSLWGPVQIADIILGNERAAGIPIQVINASLPGAPSTCAAAEQSPTTARFNGILGLGVFNYDCGTGCANFASNGFYFSCSGSTCSEAAAPLSDQVQNPVASLPTDSNGIIVELQGVPSNGAVSAGGLLVLGIGTRSNNTPPSGVTAYATDGIGEIKTTFNGLSYSSIIDSGSNGLFFPSPSAGLLPNCPSPTSGWFCPSSLITLTAANAGTTGIPSNAVFFQIGNLDSLTSTSNSVSPNIGGPVPNLPTTLFDWGLPFYFGRNIYVGINGKSSSLGTGPFFAY